MLTKANVPLLIETGWYDYWGSPLAKTWYRQTRAHNAITFDNGLGQVIDGFAEPLRANGKITAFSTSADVDYAEGDATSAYGGRLTLALRRIWYLRSDDLIVIQDKLSSATPRTLEWNFHAAAPITGNRSGAVRIDNRGQSVCLQPLLAEGMHFAARPAPEPKQGAFEAHAAFITNTPVMARVFLTVLDVGCKQTAVRLSADAKTLRAGSQTITLPD